MSERHRTILILGCMATMVLLSIFGHDKDSCGPVKSETTQVQK